MGYRRRGSYGVWMPILFVLLPMLLAATASGFFIFRGVRVLLFIQKNPAGNYNRGGSEINGTALS